MSHLLPNVGHQNNALWRVGAATRAAHSLAGALNEAHDALQREDAERFGLRDRLENAHTLLAHWIVETADMDGQYVAEEECITDVRKEMIQQLADCLGVDLETMQVALLRSKLETAAINAQREE